MTNSLENLDVSVTKWCNSNDVTFKYIGRPDIDVKGYAGYLFHFKRVGPCHKGSKKEFIISASTVTEAINVFKSDIFPHAVYKHAVFKVELLGVDFNHQRENKIVLLGV